MITISQDTHGQKIKRFLIRLRPTINLNAIHLNDFICAMTAPSAKGDGSASEDYQNLEFLGDSVIQLIVSESLYRKFKKEKVGVLHTDRVRVVRREFLATLFERFNMQEIVIIQKHFQCSTKVKCDFIEALFGALYLNLSFQEVREIWKFMTDFLA